MSVRKTDLSTKDRTNGKAVEAVDAFLPIHDTATEVHETTVLNTRRVERTRPVAATATHDVNAAIAAAASSREEQYL